MKIKTLITYLFFTSLIIGCSAPEDPSKYLSSKASYAELERLVGCDSKYSKDRKIDIFEENYKNHWMTWSGKVVLPEEGETSLNVDRIGTQDLHVEFADGRTGYYLKEDQEITVKFVMKQLGGCWLPYIGKHAILLR